MKKYVCTICGFIYDEAVGMPGSGIAPGTRWEELPKDWICPLCGAAKSDFKELVEKPMETIRTTTTGAENQVNAEEHSDEIHELKELSLAQLSAICSNLAKGCEKQYLPEESALFMQLADYYRAKAGVIENEDYSALADKVNQDLASYEKANETAQKTGDRGALRVLVWSEKVTKIMNALLARYEKEKNTMLEHTNVYVCEICGFIYIGEEPPAICPVCKVPNKKLKKIERG